MSYIETLNEKKQAIAQSSKEQQELSTMVGELKRMQMAALMGSQGKSTVILTDQTDLGDKLKEAYDKVASAIKTLDTSEGDTERLKVLKDLQEGIKDVTRAIHLSTNDNRDTTNDIINAIKGLKLDPVISVEAAKINVPTPQVTVTTPDIDVTPINDTLKAYFTPPEAKIDLDCYRAQDIKESGDIQYVGFVNPGGAWYIIENHVRENKMRYVFGTKGYAKAFKKAASYEYQLLNEAINALSA